MEVSTIAILVGSMLGAVGLGVVVWRVSGWWPKRQIAKLAAELEAAK